MAIQLAIYNNNDVTVVSRRSVVARLKYAYDDGTSGRRFASFGTVRNELTISDEVVAETVGICIGNARDLEIRQY